MISLQLTFFSHKSQKLVFIIKSVVKTQCWQTMKCFFLLLFFILAENGRGRRFIAEKEDGSNGTIVPIVTSDDSRRDHETCWLLDARSLTNPPDSVFSSPKTKGSVINQAEWSWSGIRRMFHSVGQDRTEQRGMRTEWREDRLLSRLKSLTTISAATH